MEHVSPAVLWQFVLDELELSESDFNHVLSCSQCQQFVFDAGDRLDGRCNLESDIA